MTEAEVQAFVTNYAAVWAAGVSDDFLTIWHEDGAQSRTLKGRDIPDLHRPQTVLIPSLTRQLGRWRSRDDIVVVWLCTTEASSGPFTWGGAAKFRIKGGKIVEEAVYAATAVLRAARRGAALRATMRVPAPGAAAPDAA